MIFIKHCFGKSKKSRRYFVVENHKYCFVVLDFISIKHKFLL